MMRLVQLPAVLADQPRDLRTKAAAAPRSLVRSGTRPRARCTARRAATAARAASSSGAPTGPEAMASLTTACCTLPPVKHDYSPVGVHEDVAGLKTYLAGPADADTAIVVVYDIFGLTQQAFQVCDSLAAATGFRVAMPNILRDDAWGLDNFPPPNKDVFMNWIGTTASWDKIADNDIPALLEALRANGAKKFVIVGFCWGSKVAITAANRTRAFSAVGMPHYSFIEPADFKDLACPVALLPSKDEAPEGPLMDALKATAFADKSILQRFDDMQHGWVAARGDWSDPQQAKRATEALQVLASFFKDNAQ